MDFAFDTLLILLRVFHKLVYAQPKEPPKDAKDATMKAASKLRAFIKRSSEPLLNMQPQPVRGRTEKKKIADSVLFVMQTCLSRYDISTI